MYLLQTFAVQHTRRKSPRTTQQSVNCSSKMTEREQTNVPPDSKQFLHTISMRLFRCLDPSVELNENLQSVSYLKEQSFSFPEEATTNTKIVALLKVLQNVRDQHYQSLRNEVIKVLRNSGQGHVADLLCGQSDTIMSDDHYHTLKSNKNKLCQFLDPADHLLNELESRDVISSSEAEHIRLPEKAYGFYEKARKLVETIMRKADSAYELFLAALTETGQSHVVYILTEEGDKPLMKKWRDKLVETRSFLVKNITPNSLVPLLRSNGVFTPLDEERMRFQVTDDGKCELMLNLLERKSQAAFNGFLKALEECECNHEHVLEELLGPKVDAEVEVRVNRGVDPEEVERIPSELRRDMQGAFDNDDTEVKEVNGLLSSDGISTTKIGKGSIKVKFRCRDQKALEKLQEMYRSKKLDRLFNTAFRPKFADRGLKSLSLHIPDKEFELKMMTDEHREALLSSAEWLDGKIRISGKFLDKLSLCKRCRQETERAETGKQAKTLLHIISRQPDYIYTQLLSALDVTQQQNTANYIRETCQNNAKKRNYFVPTESEVSRMTDDVCKVQPMKRRKRVTDAIEQDPRAVKMQVTSKTPLSLTALKRKPIVFFCFGIRISYQHS